MNLRASIGSRIDANRKEIESLRARIDRLEAINEGLREALALVPPDDGESVPMRRPRSASDVQRAREFLANAGRALHVSEILEGIGKEDTRSNRASLVGSLARYARRGEMFQRHAPNEFSAIEPQTRPRPQDTQESSPSATTSEPLFARHADGIPLNFGTDR